MSGNTPPYKHDPVTANVAIADRMVNFSHHQAVARENGIRSFSTGYGFTEPSANIIWAVNKVLDTDCLFSTLNSRLGLPDHMLNELPEEPALIGNAFTFEKEHADLFGGKQIAQVGVYYSSDTRDHTFFGNLHKGYYKDYAMTLRTFFGAGISANTIFSFPENTDEYAVVVVPSAVVMNDADVAAMRRYISVGGKVMFSGPSCFAECKSEWKLPSRPELEKPEDFFDTIAYGVWHKHAEWVLNTEIEPSKESCEWKNVAEGMMYNPHRMADGQIGQSMVDFVRQYAKKLPVEVLSSRGYLITMFEKEDGITVHFLAEDYDTDIDHKLDEMRFHRSRVNYVNKVEPIGVDRVVTVRSDSKLTVYTPFNEAVTDVCLQDGVYKITLPEKTSYAIMKFLK